MNFKEYLNEAREFDIIIDQLDENAGVAAAASSALAQVGGPSSLSTADAATGAALLTIATGILVLGTSATVNAFFDDWFTHPIKNHPPQTNFPYNHRPLLPNFPFVFTYRSV